MGLLYTWKFLLGQLDSVHLLILSVCVNRTGVAFKGRVWLGGFLRLLVLICAREIGVSTIVPLLGTAAGALLGSLRAVPGLLVVSVLRVYLGLLRIAHGLRAFQIAVEREWATLAAPRYRKALMILLLLLTAALPMRLLIAQNL